MSFIGLINTPNNQSLISLRLVRVISNVAYETCPRFQVKARIEPAPSAWRARLKPTTPQDHDYYYVYAMYTFI